MARMVNPPHPRWCGQVSYPRRAGGRSRCAPTTITDRENWAIIFVDHTHFAPALEHLKARMRLGLAVAVEPVASGPCRMGAEGLRAGDTVEVHLLPAWSRIGLPEALLAAEVW